jgi:hypothetical protein
MTAQATSPDPDESGTVEINRDENGKMQCPYCVHPLYEPDHTLNLKCRVCETVFEPVNTLGLASTAGSDNPKL